VRPQFEKIAKNIASNAKRNHKGFTGYSVNISHYEVYRPIIRTSESVKVKRFCYKTDGVVNVDWTGELVGEILTRQVKGKNNAEQVHRAK
jgi:tRNA A37 threonylcarbamoyladenosine biosynthesis protein TsaE